MTRNAARRVFVQESQNALAKRAPRAADWSLKLKLFKLLKYIFPVLFIRQKAGGNRRTQTPETLDFFLFFHY
jgi:hypothetical protein